MPKKIKAQRKYIFSRPLLVANLYDEAMAYPVEQSEGTQMVSTIPVFPLGKFNWHHHMPNGFEITPQVIQDFVDNFHAGYPQSELPVYVGHNLEDEDRKAYGWVKELLNRGDKGLWAVVEWTYEGLDLIRNKAYKYISPEWYFKIEDERDGKTYQNVLCAPALVNEPFFNKMPTITASNKNKLTIIDNDMNLQELIGKLATGELTDEEKAYIVEHKDEVAAAELSDEQKTAFEALVPAEESEEKEEAESEETEGEAEKTEEESTEETTEEEAESEEKEGEESEETEGEKTESEESETEGEVEGEETAETRTEETGGEEKATASKKHVRVSASRLRQLEADSQELQKTRIVASLKGHTPATIDAASEFAMKLDKAELRDEFLKLMTASKGEVSTERKSVADKGKAGYDSAQEELTDLAKKRQKKDGGTLDSAMTKVMKEKPELAKRVDAERAKK